MSVARDVDRGQAATLKMKKAAVLFDEQHRRLSWAGRM